MTSYLEAKEAYEKACEKALRMANAQAYSFWWTTERGIREYTDLLKACRRECGTLEKLRTLNQIKASLPKWLAA